MEKAFLLILLSLELALMAYSLITKSYQAKTRGVARIVISLIFFVLIAVLFGWGTRWYGLAALLCLWIAFGVWTLFRRKEKFRAYKAGRVILRTITTLLLILLAMTPALLFPRYRPLEASGPHAVVDTQYTYTDESRIEPYTDTEEARKVNVAFWYPADAEGSYPLVLFSHGSLGIITSNLCLYKELASHGYVVASIGHPYQSLWATDTDGQTTLISMDFFREVQQENPRIDKRQSHAYYQKWMNVRMGDINFALDTILAKATEGERGVYHSVDATKIGVMGHSLGGSAALGIGRQRDDIDAVIALESPFMFDIQGVKNDEFIFTGETYPVPVLNIYSDSSWDHLSEWTQYAANAALLSDAGATAFNVHISDVGHLGLTDLSLSSPPLVQLADGPGKARSGAEGLAIINEISLEFLDAYLKDRGKFTGSGSR